MKNNPFSLKNKSVFIFGGSGLIGSQITKTLLDFEAKVFVLDINRFKYSKKYNKKNTNLVDINFDISDVDNLDNNLKKIFKIKKCPDVVINCSYPIVGDWINSSFDKNKIKLLRNNVDAHLNSSCWIAYKFCEEMKKNKIRGSVIQFSSIYGSLGQNISLYKKTKMKENMNYSIIKGGITNFTRQLCSYYGKYNIRINTISPGGIIGHIKGSKKNQSKQFLNNYAKLCPLKRLGKPQEVANVVLFLSSEASSYVSGMNLFVDGGWNAI